MYTTWCKGREVSKRGSEAVPRWARKEDKQNTAEDPSQKGPGISRSRR